MSEDQLTKPSLSLGARLAVIALVLIVEAVLHTYLFQSVPYIANSQLHGFIQTAQHSLFRFAIAYLSCCFILSWTNNRAGYEELPVTNLRSRLAWGAIHVVLVLALGATSYELHAASSGTAYAVLSVIWLTLGCAAIVALFSVLATVQQWLQAARRYRFELLCAILPATATIVLFQFSQSTWRLASQITFFLVAGELRAFNLNLYTDLASRIIGTGNFQVIIADECSGMEGISLMLIFCAAFLWFYRRDYHFPRALIVIPFALILIFLLNSLRISILILIGNAGYANIASVGFHSQAGWMMFNGAALGVAVAARHSEWLRRPTLDTPKLYPTENPVVPFLVPLLILLSAGMISRALSGGFEFLYPLRLIGGGIALLLLRKHLNKLNWGFSWRGVSVGAMVFLLWILLDHVQNAPLPRPEALSEVSGIARNLWVICRAIAAVVTVPIIEELAFRGYLMRVLVSRDFDSVAFRSVRWSALVVSSIAFGALHGRMWLAGVIAGAAYGGVLIRTNKFGEAVVAHGTTNALLAISVIGFNNWQFW